MLRLWDGHVQDSGKGSHVVIIWVNGAAVGMPCNQRAKVIKFEVKGGGSLTVELQGTGEHKVIVPQEICGVEFAEGASVRWVGRPAFHYTGVSV